MEDLRSEVRYAINAKDRKSRNDEPRYNSAHKVLDECRRLIAIAEKCLFDGEYKHGYDSLNSAQRRLHRLMGDKMSTKQTMVRANELMTITLELENMMANKPQDDAGV